MAEHAAGPGAHGAAATGRISIPWVLLAAVLSGLGLFLVTFWLLTGDWVYFVGIPIVIVGCLMFFSPRMGIEHA